MPDQKNVCRSSDGGTRPLPVTSTIMSGAFKVAIALVVLVTLIFFPWSGASSACALGVPGGEGGCVTEYMSPLGLRYPEWLGAIFYMVLLFAVGGLLLIPFRRLDQRSKDDENPGNASPESTTPVS